MCKRHAKGGITHEDNPAENQAPEVHLSYIGVETAFDNCAIGCPNFRMSERVPPLCHWEGIHTCYIEPDRGVQRYCEHIESCKRMAKHFEQFTNGDEEEES